MLASRGQMGNGELVLSDLKGFHTGKQRTTRNNQRRHFEGEHQTGESRGGTPKC